MPKGIWKTRLREPLFEAHKLAVSESLNGRTLTEEHRRRIGLASLDRQPSDETKGKISVALRGHYYGGGFQKGRTTSTEHRARISKANIGKHSSFKTEEHKRKISQTAIARGLGVKEKNSNWQGGISYLPYPPEFDENLKELIRDRDGRICQVCGVPECECDQKLSVHHIDYDKRNFAKANLISLCKCCSGKVHHSREHWQAYFNAKLEVIYA